MSQSTDAILFYGHCWKDETLLIQTEGEWYCGVPDSFYQLVQICTPLVPKTRGQLRRLCRALGIELKEQV